MIAITCTLNEARLGRRMQMWIDHHALFGPITKASMRLRPGSIAETLAQALRLAMSEPQGPVHLDLPEDVALAAATEAIPKIPRSRRSAPAGERADRGQSGLTCCARRPRPIAVIGMSAMRDANSPGSSRSFVERHQHPVASTTMAKGLIDEDHPLSLGCIERAKRQVQRRPFSRAPTCSSDWDTTPSRSNMKPGSA